jgi:hypothetical protein
VVQQRSVLWFELLITAAYLGAGSALVERLLLARRGSPNERTALTGELETVSAALESVAGDLSERRHGPDAEVRALLIRFSAQQALDRTCALAAELLGGTAFVTSGDVACLLASARGLAFHPPARGNVAQALDGYWQDGQFGGE